MLQIFSLIALGALMAPSLALAAVNLKKVTIVDGSQIELLFDAKVEPGQVKTEFVRDNIQLSLSNTSVYPAKVSMVSGSDLTKVFAYQYSPALVRARFTVKGEASNYANRLQVKITGKTVTVRIAPARVDEVAATASSALRAVTTTTSNEADDSKAAAQKAEQRALLDRVAAEKSELKSETKTEQKEAKTEKDAEKSGGLTGKKSGKKESLAGGKSLPSPFRSIGVMLFVLGVFGLFIMFLKRLKSGEANAKSAKAPKGAIGGFLNKISGGATHKGLIEVIATHHLAPKRSIVVVRVQDRMLVLGMTNDAVNLITEFRSGEDGEADENIGLGDFAASLKKFEENAELPAPPRMAEPKLGTVSAKANLGDIAAAALGLAKPRPASAPKATAAANAYQTSQTKAAPPTVSSGGPGFSPALEAALREPSVKPSIRAQIKDRVQGMKQL